MDHEAQVHEALSEHGPFLQRVAGRELVRAGLDHRESGEIVSRVLAALVRRVRSGKMVLAEVQNWPATLTSMTRYEVMTAIREARRDRRYVLTDDVAGLPEAASGAWSSDEPLWEGLDREARMALLQLLPKKLCRLLLCRYEWGMDLQEATAVAGVSAKQARSLMDGLARKVAAVGRGGVLRGRDASGITAFAHGMIALRNERSGRE